VRNPRQSPERGSSLIVVILVIAFMLAVGVAILSNTGIGPKVAGSVRDQDEAFNAAEAGFETARALIEGNVLSGSWTNLSDNCLRTPTGIDDPNPGPPPNPNYFRRQSDTALLQMLSEGVQGVLFYKKPFVKKADGTDDTSREFTVFLIDQGFTSEAIMVCIGVVQTGTRVLATSRLEIELGLGKNP
jgi:hypothetical protein